MEESFVSFSSDHSAPGSPQATLFRPSGSNSTGLTLVLPPLKGGKPVKSGKKSKQRLGSQGFQDGLDFQGKKAPRPLKLKPLKEVLSKLITQIKKKDDYAFFLKPVDPSQIAGYSDVVKRPMDLGTMTNKVNRGRYRSLEDFASDFRLVTSNAKIFNPPGTIYHTEADRIEAWGLDHIAKAAPTVIQYETDWNIEIEKDDDGHTVNVEDDDDYNVGTPMDIDETGTGGRSPSVVSQVQQGPTRRGVRGPYKKTNTTSTNANGISETLDADGRLPGSKDGLGAFPPGSDWARTMVVLKLKGKRYRTKKERLRIEKEGPPFLPEGSLDYHEMEDPFSFLSALVPDAPSRPLLTPLYPPTSFATSQSQPQYDPSQLQSQPPQPSASFPTPVNVPLNDTPPTLPILDTNPSNAPKRRHWAIIRNPPSRKGKEKDDDFEVADTPSWQLPREAHAVDFASFALLAGELAEEMRRRGIVSKEGEEEESAFQVLRDSLDCQAAAKRVAPEEGSTGATVFNDASGLSGKYWTTQRAMEAEDYIRDVVYGGIDGLAYVRSLAEFVHTDPEDEFSLPLTPSSDFGLGMPLAQWVERHIIDPLTEGHHSLLRDAALHLAFESSPIAAKVQPDQQNLANQVSASLHIYPVAMSALSALMQIKTHKIDMGALIKTPEELFLSEEEWAGKVFKERRKLNKENGNTLKAGSGTADSEMEVEEPERTWMDVDLSVGSAKGAATDQDYELEGPEELNEVLEYVAEVIAGLDRKIKEGLRESGEAVQVNGSMDSQEKKHVDPDISEPIVVETIEDPVLRNLRLNLLALAKRAPLDTIARLPKDLVPEHIRHFVPTLGISS